MLVLATCFFDHELLNSSGGKGGGCGRVEGLNKKEKKKELIDIDNGMMIERRDGWWR